MERRYQARLDELLGDAEVRPGLLRGLLPRLETFLEPFVESLCCAEQRTNAQHYVSGLLSDLATNLTVSLLSLSARRWRTMTLGMRVAQGRRGRGAPLSGPVG